MLRSSPRIVVIGGGIAGAATIWTLARAGLSATLLETARTPAAGVTAKAFGWINLVHSDPESAAAYALRREAVAEHERLAIAHPAAYAGMRRGSLLWHEDEAETEALIARHQAAGTPLRLVNRAEIAAIEPALRAPPRLAAFAAADMALDDAALATWLVGDAAGRGARIRLDEAAIAIETRGGGVSGVVTPAGRIAADCVIVAAGPHSEALIAPLGVTLGLEISPVRLLRFSASDRFIRRIVDAPGLEIRQRDDGLLLAPVGAEGDVAGKTASALDALARHFAPREDIRFLDAAIGDRPVFSDGLPRIGFVPGIAGLATAVGHPGVILAPLMGRMIASAVSAAFGLAVQPAHATPNGLSPTRADR